MKKMVIAGGTGFLGSVLSDYFKDKVDLIVILTRGKSVQKENIKYVHWDAANLSGWEQHLEAADALINLTGKSVDCRYNSKNKKEILNSRITSTKILQKAVNECKKPPAVWINSSTATIYEHSEKEPMSEENGIIGNDFSMNVARQWEASFFKNTEGTTRKVALRTSIVMGNKGGAMQPLKMLTKFGLGGKQGKGNQMVSWIHETDFARAVAFVIVNTQLTGVLNVTAPNPIQNCKLMKTFQQELHIPFGINIPKILLEVGAILIGTETELVLKSRFVIPEKLQQNGFAFTYPSIDGALKNLLGEINP